MTPVAAVEYVYGLEPGTIASGSRASRVVRARACAAWLLRERGLSYPEIGRALGCCHTTALLGVRRAGLPGMRARLELCALVAGREQA